MTPAAFEAPEPMIVGDALRPNRRDDLIGALCVLGCLGIAAVDLVSPTLMMMLYPVAMLPALWQRRPMLPPMLAVLAVVLSVLDMLLGPRAADLPMWVLVTNRLLAAMAFTALAWVLHLLLRERREIREMVWSQDLQLRLTRALAGDLGVEELAARAVQSVCESIGAPVGVLVGRMAPVDLASAAPNGTGWTDAAFGGPVPRRAFAAIPGDAARLVVLGRHGLGMAPRDEWPSAPGGVLMQAMDDARFVLLPGDPDGRLRIETALMSAAPQWCAIIPLVAEGRVLGALELGLMRVENPVLLESLAARIGEQVGIALTSAIYRVERQALLLASQSQTEELQAQQEELRVTNEELLAQGQTLYRTQESLRRQTEELAAASRYKSEFLANMSHELRTPLNSSLILSRLLMDNASGTLGEEQIRHARAIHDANRDLLTLINDVLDLSKVEAGRLEIVREQVDVEALVRRLAEEFHPQAQHKGLAFDIEVLPAAPTCLLTDGHRLQQVLRNLLSNALKFTAEGSVTVRIAGQGNMLALTVADTGPGIPPEQQELIFEAFRQADGSISRRFGGTGLGLAITRELVHLLGGEITLHSVPGEGSRFVVTLPADEAAARPDAVPPTRSPARHAMRVEDDDLMAAERRAEAAREARPRVVVVEADAGERQRAAAALAGVAPQLELAASLGEAAAFLQPADPPAVLVLDRFDDETLELAERLEPLGTVCLLHAPWAPPAEAELRLQAVIRATVVRGPGALERLRDEVVHALAPPPPAPASRIGIAVEPRPKAGKAGARGPALDGRRLLLAEDDVRTIFAVSALLEREGAQVDIARHGEEALAWLRGGERCDLVLMDLMMPGMDGLSTIRALRADPSLASLPVIALTAKATPQDRQACLDAGANDYLAKPVAVERLLAICSHWIETAASAAPPQAP